MRGEGCPGTENGRYARRETNRETAPIFPYRLYKLELDGRVVGRFGSAGKLPKELGLVNAIDCRIDNELYIGELTNWCVQKRLLHP